jgi:hypothetical protein
MEEKKIQSNKDDIKYLKCNYTEDYYKGNVLGNGSTATIYDI